MSVDETAWVLEALATDWALADVPTFVNRDDSADVQTGERSTAHDLTDANAVSAATAPGSETPTTFGYDLAVEATVSLRIEALHADEWGHIETPADWDALTDEVRRILLARRVWPLRNPDGDVHYHTLRLANPTDRSAEHRDYYRYDVDVVFVGREDLD